MNTVALISGIVVVVCGIILMICFNMWDSDTKKGIKSENSLSNDIAKIAFIVGAIAVIIVFLYMCSGDFPGHSDFEPRHT